MEIGIVADDLTGAADSVAPFARRGYRASVGFELKHSMERFPLAEGDVLAYDTATRDFSTQQEDTIRATIRRAARRMAALQPRIIFKKIDSTLRGHLRIELEAMRADFPNRLALICPSFPAQGRAVQTGVLHIHNVPWTATEFAPSGMFASLTVRGAFGMETDKHTAEIGIGAVRPGAEALEKRFEALKAQGVQTIFCDAILPSDLTILAATILRAPHRYLPVGSGGLAHAIAELLPSPADPNPHHLRTLQSLDLMNSVETLESLVQPFVNGRVLVVVGSLHAASRRQMMVLVERLEAVPVVIAATEDLKSNSKLCVERAVDQLSEQYDSGKQVALLTTSDRRESGFSKDFGWLPGSIAWRACLRGQRVGMPIDGLIVCGGDTAKEFCRTCNGTGLRVVHEWQPGVAITHLNCEPDVVNNFSFDGLPMITKAGGFGDDLTLARCVGLQ